jgi:hypothetical protein
MTLVQRSDITAEHVEIRVHRQDLHDLLAAQSIEPIWTAPSPQNHDSDILSLTVAATLQRVGREMKMVAHSAEH